ncbi:hypothetical protein M569_02547, partial [Genlisea aurea]
REKRQSQPPPEHPFAFQVSGPRNVPAINWKDLISSSWKNSNYKRTVMACFIQAVYLLELDRQENRTQSTALAPHWWIPFKYRLVQSLVDQRDGSVFGAVFEWDRSAALSDFVLLRPTGAPRAVLALRGTLLKTSTIRRDIEDDLRFLAWESLRGSSRFASTLEALRSITDRYGGSNVCFAGHSLGAGFALQVGKALAKEGIFVETHLFNPPSVSLASSLRGVGEKAATMWHKVKAMIPLKNEEDGTTSSSSSIIKMGSKPWIPHLYVNSSDYICCNYTDPVCDESSERRGADEAKMFVFSKGKQKFLEAHGLEQWWSEELELQKALNTSKLISRQLKSLYRLP